MLHSLNRRGLSGLTYRSGLNPAPFGSLALQASFLSRRRASSRAKPACSAYTSLCLRSVAVGLWAEQVCPFSCLASLATGSVAVGLS